MKRIIIVVSGGVVTDVYCDDEQVTVDVLDHDRTEDRFRRTNQKLEQEIKELHEVY